jgi:hypothetical protein
MCCVVALVLAGCGGGSGGAPRVSPRDTVEAYFTADAHGDGATMCRLLSSEALEGVAEEDGGCRAAVLRELAGRPSSFRVVELTAHDDAATAVVTFPKRCAAGDKRRCRYQARLLREDGRWLIRATEAIQPEGDEATEPALAAPKRTGTPSGPS